MSTDLIDSIKTIELDWFEDNDVVRVTPRNQQRFEIQKDRAIEILQLASQAESFGRQFSLLLNHLAEWISERQEFIEAAILTLQDANLAFVVVRNSARYDEKFEDDMADLAFDVANDPDLDLVGIKTIALPLVPKVALQSFVDERLALSYGGRGRPHSSSQQKS